MTYRHQEKRVVDILSDFVCPWCVIGYRRLLVAIRELELEDEVVIRWHPFELNPQLPERGENLRQHLAKKYGTTLEGSVKARAQLNQLGKAAGFRFDYFDAMRMFNTRKAHTLILWAGERDKQAALAEALFSAYFSLRQNISDTEVLLSIAEKVGLDSEKAKSVIGDQDYLETLLDTEEKWLAGGFRGVPAIIIGKGEVLLGAEDIASYKLALQNVPTHNPAF